MVKLETLLALERTEIVAKYEQGHQSGSPADPDPWDDSDLSCYKVTYRWEQPGLSTQGLSIHGLSTHKARQRAQDIRRATKWVKMLRNWSKYQGSRKMRRRVYKGIPPQVRGQAWSLLLDLEKVKVENQGKYQRMKEQARLYSRDIKYIDMDVSRTFQNNIMFQERYGIKQQALFNVLTAYSVYNTEVGYCHGMNQIVAILLMFLNEEDAFWALAQLMDNKRHAMHGFFIPEFPKLQRLQAHHDKILERTLPKLKRHLDKEYMYTEIYTKLWFQHCFIDQTPFSLTLRLWDVYILEGERMLTAMAYTIIKLHRKHLLKLPLQGLYEFLQDKISGPWALEDDAVIKKLQASMAELHRKNWDLPPPAKPEEFPTRTLGLERSSLEPKPCPTITSIKELSVEDGPDLPGPPAKHQQPGPSHGQACLKAEEHQQERAMVPQLRWRAREPPRLACPFPPLDIPQDRMWPWRWASLPNIPKNYECPLKWPIDIGFEPECWDLCPSARAKVALRATLQA
ncbi:USP6 N-terminal-like protein [Phacochoerus africanus]|uniref:USP6 N-terminal-like protein n=1 Tax=Phacochoerus africanus TaxID=41426 RepID=UPI001FDAA003|nr:USP6 N-terminal-like protein isoform X2 [Phacochoerus africanus]XP_047622064.1 USP6 N-terminal-like protein [Phacochoerus africanus]